MASGDNSSKNDQKDSDGWCVEEPEESKYNFSDEKGLWQPKPEDILSLFEKLAGGGSLPLKWQCPGRRPSKSKEEVIENNPTERTDLEKDEEKDEKPVAVEASAFDFDEFPNEANTKLTPIRAPGGTGRTPRTKKRARMDNIMHSLRKQHLQSVAEREARRAKGSPSGTPKSGLFGMKRSQAANSMSTAASVTVTSPAVAQVAPSQSAPTMDSSTVTTPSHKNLPASPEPRPISSLVPSTNAVTTTNTQVLDTNTNTTLSAEIPASKASVANSREALPDAAVGNISVAQTTSMVTQASDTSHSAPDTSLPQTLSMPGDTISSLPGVTQNSASLTLNAPIISSAVSLPSIPTQQTEPTETHLTSTSSSAEQSRPVISTAAALPSKPTAITAAVSPITTLDLNPAGPTTAASSSSHPVQAVTIPTASSGQTSELMLNPSTTSSSLAPTSAVPVMSSTSAAVTTAPPTIPKTCVEHSVPPPPIPQPLSGLKNLKADDKDLSLTSTSASSTSTPATDFVPVVPVTVSGQTSEPPASEPKQSISTCAPATGVPATSTSETNQAEIKTVPATSSISETTAKDNVENEIKSLNLEEKS